MKVRWIKLSKWLLGILGISACQPVMYGCPYSNIKVNGTVVDNDGKPIPGISVGDRVMTEKDGTFAFSSDSDILGPASDGLGSSFYSLSVKDIDGEANGGRFEDKSVKVPLVKLQGGKGFYMGAFANRDDVTIVLEKAAPHAYYTISGKVVDDSGHPVAEMYLSDIPTGTLTRTDQDGLFTLSFSTTEILDSVECKTILKANDYEMESFLVKMTRVKDGDENYLGEFKNAEDVKVVLKRK